MTREEKYDAINKTKTLKELAKVILSFADENGMIQGRTRKFNAEQYALNCINYNLALHNALTREFGIRQQAMMLTFYRDMEEYIILQAKNSNLNE